MSDEDLAAKLAAYDVIQEVQELNTLRYQNRNRGCSAKLAQSLTEALLEKQALTLYKVPLCFREIDDDLQADYDEQENALD